MHRIPLVRVVVAVLVTALTVALAAGCGTRSDGGSAAQAVRASELPPPVAVRAGDETLELHPWSTCWTHIGCLDGFAPAELPDLGTVDGPLTVTFPRDGWRFDVNLLNVEHAAGSGPCHKEYVAARVVAAGDRSWTVHPRGPAGRYSVEVSGRGPEGDVVVTFAMTTSTDRPWPPPEATTAVSRHWADTGAFSFLLHLDSLAAPDRVRAKVTLVGGDARRVVPLERRNARCNPPTFLDFSASPASAPIIRRLGFPPYKIRFDVDIDGTRHVATTGRPPYPASSGTDAGVIRLHFTPGLPAR